MAYPAAVGTIVSLHGTKTVDAELQFHRHALGDVVHLSLPPHRTAMVMTLTLSQVNTARGDEQSEC